MHLLMVQYEISALWNDPAEIINVVIQSLVEDSYELPAYYKLDKTVSHIRTQINQSIFAVIVQKVS